MKSAKVRNSNGISSIVPQSFLTDCGQRAGNAAIMHNHTDEQLSSPHNPHPPKLSAPTDKSWLLNHEGFAPGVAQA
eukprot:4440875-Amphidinium_carterae.1